MAENQTAPEGDTEQAVSETASTQTPQEGATQTEAVETKAEETPAVETTTEDKGLLSGAEDMQESAPESYEDFTLGDGVEASDQEALKTLAKKQNLTQADAQKAATFSKSIVEQIAQEEETAMEKFRADNKAEWEGKADHAQNTLLASKAVKQLGPEMEKYLADSGHLNDAKVLGILSQLGKFMSEPTHVAGTETAPGGAGRIYNQSPELYS